MTNPVPGFKVTTPYKKTGPYWKACGWHTGVDFAAPKGTLVVAARGGKVKHTSYGSAFGDKQFAILCPDGTEDFYAHTDTRPINGKIVVAGQAVAKVGARGNVSGPHLHFERHAKQGQWNCGNMRDPKASIDAETVVVGKVYLSKLKYGQKDSDSVKRLQLVLNRHKLAGGSNLPITGNYFSQTDKEIRLCQQQHGFGNDSEGESNVGPKQAAHLFDGTGMEIIDDREPETPTVKWFPAPALVALFKEVDAKWPGRSKKSDGTIGDYAHSKSKNEHNPVGHPFGPKNGTPGSVHAADITSADIDSMKVVKNWLIGDPRVWYVIHKGKIWSKTYDWAERDYNGSNPHDTHIHVSLREDTQEIAVAAEQNVSKWEKSVVEPPEPPPVEPPDPPEPELPESITFPLGIEYWYSGKPKGELTVREEYKRLDVPSWAPKRDGVTFGMLYLNVDPTFKSNKSMGALRVRVIREAYKGEPDDQSAYKDFLMIGNWLITHVWFEKGEAGRPLHWEMDCRLGLEKAVIGTRYAKFFTIPFVVTIPLSKIVASGKKAAEGFKRLFG